MTDLARWQPSYHMAASSGITYSRDFTLATVPGPYGTGTTIVYLKNEPPFNPGREIITNRKSTGNAYLTKGGTTSIERITGVEAPTTSFEFDFDTKAAFIPLLTLFQDTSGASIGGTTATTKTFNCYSSSTVSKYAVLLRALETSKSQLIKGAIANSVTISGTEGEAVTMSVEWLGADMDGDASSSVIAWAPTDAESFLMFKDITCGYSDGTTDPSETTVDIVGFDITITNNAVARHYNNATIQKYILGDFMVEGTLRFPWGATTVGSDTFFTHLNAGTDFQIALYKNIYLETNGSTVDGEFSILLNVEADDSVTTSDDEITNEVSFTGIYDGTSYPVSIHLNDDCDRRNY